MIHRLWPRARAGCGGGGSVARWMPRCDCGCTGEAPNAAGIGPAHPGVLPAGPAFYVPPVARGSAVQIAAAPRAVALAIEHVPKLLG